MQAPLACGMTGPGPDSASGWPEAPIQLCADEGRWKPRGCLGHQAGTTGTSSSIGAGLVTLGGCIAPPRRAEELQSCPREAACPEGLPEDTVGRTRMASPALSPPHQGSGSLCDSQGQSDGRFRPFRKLWVVTQPPGQALSYSIYIYTEWPVAALDTLGSPGKSTLHPILLLY